MAGLGIWDSIYRYQAIEFEYWTKASGKLELNLKKYQILVCLTIEKSKEKKIVKFNFKIYEGTPHRRELPDI